MQLSDVVLIGGVFGIGYWVGKKAIPQGQRIEETKSLLKLAQKCQELAPTQTLKKEAAIVVFEIETYIKDGIDKKSETEHKSMISSMRDKIVSMVKKKPAEGSDADATDTIDATDSYEVQQEEGGVATGRISIKTPGPAKF